MFFKIQKAEARLLVKGSPRASAKKNPALAPPHYADQRSFDQINVDRLDIDKDMNLLVLRAGLYHGLSHHPQPGEDLRPGLPRRLHLPHPARGSGHGRVIIILRGVIVYIQYIVQCT